MLTDLTPTVYHDHILPRKCLTYRLTFRFSAGTIGVSKGLLQRLELGPGRQLGVFQIGSGWFISQVDTGGVFCSVTTGGKQGQAGAIIYRRALTDHVRQALGCDLDEVLRVEVTRYPVAGVVGLTDHPYPVFRLLIDPTT